MQICIEAMLTTALVICASELFFLPDLVIFLGLRPSAVQNDALVVQNSSEIGCLMVRRTDRGARIPAGKLLEMRMILEIRFKCKVFRDLGQCLMHSGPLSHAPYTVPH